MNIKSIDNDIKLGETLMLKGSLDQAQHLFLEVLNKSPNNSKALSNIGMIMLTKNEYKKAENYYIRSLSNDKLNQDTIKKLIYIYTKTGEPKKASAYQIKLSNINTISKKKEKNASFYNRAYKDGGWNKEYFKHYANSNNYETWKKVTSWITEIPDCKIIEIGCGPGQLANMLFDNGIIDYHGIDFSKVAINIAKTKNPNFAHCFDVEDAFKSEIFHLDYNVVIILEVLEHIEDDIILLKRIKGPTRVIFSVPNFDSQAHVRWFTDKDEIIERYSDIVKIDFVHEICYPNSPNKVFLMNGIKTID